MDNFIKERLNSSLSKQYTKLSIRLKPGQTKHKRPILFIVPAEARTKLTYTLHGKDKDLFGLREESDSGILALFYQQQVSTTSESGQNHSVVHHIRVIGQKARHARHEHTLKDLNMKIKIAVLAKATS